MTAHEPIRPRLVDIATQAGVSVSTASRVLAGRGEVAAATRDRILGVADALGYQRTGERRGRPRTSTVQLIDLVLGQFHDTWSDVIFAGARTEADRLGYDLVLTSERETAEDDWQDRIRHRGSAGVVLGLIAPTVPQLEALDRAQIPLVLLDPRAEVRVPVAAVGMTDRLGGAEAARHLLRAGARRFLVLTGAPHYRFGRARVEGFVTTVREEMPEARIDTVNTRWTIHDARAEVRDPLGAAVALGDDLGVFACADELAFGVYGAAADLGLRIPDDLQVVGFDDFRDAKWVRPGLTSVHQPAREMAAAAVRLIDGAVHGQTLVPGAIELPTHLVVRGSTRLGDRADRENGPILAGDAAQRQ